MANVAARHDIGIRGCLIPATMSHMMMISFLDVPDQTAIVRQYMRYTTQIMSGKNVAKVVMRALQLYALFLTSL